MISAAIGWIRNNWTLAVVVGGAAILVTLVLTIAESCRKWERGRLERVAADAGALAERHQGEAQAKQTASKSAEADASVAEKAADDLKQRQREVECEYIGLRDARVELDDALRYLWGEG